jgi:hypothetical protein
MKPREGKHSRSTEFNEKKFNSRMNTAVRIEADPHSTTFLQENAPGETRVE